MKWDSGRCVINGHPQMHGLASVLHVLILYFFSAGWLVYFIVIVFPVRIHYLFDATRPTIAL